MEPENNNNATTVGGVTFGGGNTNTPKTEPVTTFEEVLETIETPVPTAAEPKTEGPKAEVPQPIAGVPQTETPQPLTEGTKTEAPQPITPVQTTLNVPFVSPTTFDEKNTVHPIIKDPSLPNIPQPRQAGKPAKIKNETPEQTLKKFTTLSIVFGILAAVFLILGVVGLVFGLTQADQLATTNKELDNANLIIRAVEESTGVEKIVTVADVPVYKATTGYIYISEWGIKIKIPDNLEYVSYILNQNYRPSICFNAVQKGVQYFPDFANIQLNPGRMGCLTRIATSEGSFDAATGLSFGTLVFTNKDFNYFYTGPTDYSNPETDAANLGLEHTADQIIKNMLTDNIETYE